MDQKDPFNLEKILSIEPGTQVLIFSTFPGSVNIKKRTFVGFDNSLGYIRIVFSKKTIGDNLDYEQFATVRFIALLPKMQEFSSFELFGNENQYAEELAKLIKVSFLEISQEMEYLKTEKINSELKISTPEIVRFLKQQNVPV